MVILVLTAVALTYHRSTARWPGNGGRNGTTDMSETDMAGERGSASAGSIRAGTTNRAGASSGVGFHKAALTQTR
jgi:hypothetical protein